mmetsp:Transcript_19855/g.48098  ORF Transcript_19855/g.48098 Transcript_19855/m.48098 type:complete len:225 (+) Transcript_19855:691-1365(+)
MWTTWSRWLTTNTSWRPTLSGTPPDGTWRRTCQRSGSRWRTATRSGTSLARCSSGRPRTSSGSSSGAPAPPRFCPTRRSGKSGRTSRSTLTGTRRRTARPSTRPRPPTSARSRRSGRISSKGRRAAAPSTPTPRPSASRSAGATRTTSRCSKRTRPPSRRSSRSARRPSRCLQQPSIRCAHLEGVVYWTGTPGRGRLLDGRGHLLDGHTFKSRLVGVSYNMILL